METKTCPRCGQELFSDMDVCFECLYEFRQVEECGRSEAPARLRVTTCAVDFTIPVPEEGLSIGRGSACDVMLHAPAVSRSHVLVVPHDGALAVMNQGARNPPTISGKEVSESARMSPGDVLDVCGSMFCYESPDGRVT